MARPFCDRCKTEVILDSDGRSCPNCHKTLVIAAPKPPPPRPRTPPTPTPAAAKGKAA